MSFIQRTALSYTSKSSKNARLGSFLLSSTTQHNAISLTKHQNTRSFFASSTDHTTLLSEAEVHRLTDTNSTITNYVLVANGMDEETVRKVPQLHLGRLSFDTKERVVYGAKVVNKTLGETRDVCDRLLDAAFIDGGGGTIKARSTLWGMTDWMTKVLEQQEEVAKLGLDEKQREILKRIASDGVYDENDVAVKEIWERVVGEFLSRGLGSEAALYQAKEGILTDILHKADESEFADTSGGVMALFSFR